MARSERRSSSRSSSSFASSAVLVLVFLFFAVESLRTRFSGGGETVSVGWKISVDGMTCGGCSSRLERVLNAHDEVNSAHVDLGGASAKVDGSISATTLEQLIADAGFEPGQPEAVG